MIAVVDAGTGNLGSVVRALETAVSLRHADAPALDVRITADPAVVRDASRVVVPGQGAFGDCARALSATSALGQSVRDAIARGVPYLGICLGLQVLFDASEEAPGCAGLGVFRGTVRRLRQPPPGTAAPIKIPHVGWNRITPIPTPNVNVNVNVNVNAPAAPLSRLADPALRVLGPDDWYYFVHSYAVEPEDPAVVLATSEHGGPFVAACGRGNVLAVQFHPEKSQRAGLSLLARWLDADAARITVTP